jgi:hypothetical protein
MNNKGFISRMIYYVLVNDKETRDDWMLVVKKVHDIEMINYKIDKVDYYDSLFSYKLTNPQTISRIWRKIQEHNPDLRGEFWLDRQRYAKGVSTEIVKGGYFQLDLFK